MNLTKINILIGIICFLIVFGCNANYQSIYGTWMPEQAQTFKLRIDKGIPWHSKKKYSINKTVLFSKNKRYQVKNKATGELLDSGNFSIYKKDGNDIYIRLYPKDNRFNVNNSTIENLKKNFVALPGDKVPFLIGFTLLDNNMAKSFSLVLVSKDNVVKKDDNIIWKKNTVK